LGTAGEMPSSGRREASGAAITERDYRLLLAARVLRSFAFGFVTVLLAIYLERRGMNSQTIGLALGLGLLTGSLYGLPLAALASRLGRRRILAAVGLLMAITGLDLGLATQPWLLILAAATGMLGASSVDMGPFLALEQAILTQSVSADRRNRAFGRYSLTGALAAAAGALTAGLGTTTGRMQAFFLLHAAIGITTAVLALALSHRVEISSPGPVLSRKTAKPLAALSALFAMDSLGGGLVAQAVIAYWLHVKFGAGIQILGPALGAMALVQAASYEAASRLGDRFGLVPTMVFTHLPSNVLLILVPFSPNLAVAVGILILRFCISQMDVPVRQAYVASIVPASERAGALALTGTARGVAQAIGPALAGTAIQAASYGTPFFAAGGLKIVYDLSLYAAFKRRPADHEAAASSIGAGRPA
jgi:MFS family permease